VPSSRLQRRRSANPSWKYLFESKTRPEAETKFRSALGIQPNTPPALLGLAKSLEAQKKPEAAEAYKNYLATQPNDPGAGARIVRALIDGQKYDEALAELDRTDAGKPPTLDSLRMRADVFIAQKKWTEATTTIQQAVALTPKDAHCMEGWAACSCKTRFPRCGKRTQNAIELDRNNLVYWKDLSSNYYLWGISPPRWYAGSHRQSGASRARHLVHSRDLLR